MTTWWKRLGAELWRQRWGLAGSIMAIWGLITDDLEVLIVGVYVVLNYRFEALTEKLEK